MSCHDVRVVDAGGSGSVSATESQGGAESCASIPRGIKVPECPLAVRSNLKREVWVSNSRLLGNILEVSARGIDLARGGLCAFGHNPGPKALAAAAAR